MRFLIVDGYPRSDREQLERCGVPPAWKLYADMLRKRAQDVAFDVMFIADSETELPTDEFLSQYAGVLWTGSSLTVYHAHDDRVARQIKFARRCYRVGIPAFGSCWGIQVAAVAAGGQVEAHPMGREMFLARKISLTQAGREHPMFRGKPSVYDGFISHLDQVTVVPEGGVVLAGNYFTPIQALAVKHHNGVFWATQYHPEYTLSAMAKLCFARRQALLQEGFFRGTKEAQSYLTALNELALEPGRKDLRFWFGIDSDVCDAEVRQIEFINWLQMVREDNFAVT